jgi:hypothetical protein
MRFLLSLFLATALCTAADARPRGAPDLRIQKNLVADYGATCNGVADDSAAFLAFKAAYQGSTPVQLNLPGHCTWNQGGFTFLFSGITDLIVAGNGTATSGIKNIGSGGFAFGSPSQVQDNNNSLRTNTANAGDSCVIVKTAPSITISNVAPNVAPVASFTASASGTTLTVTAVSSGTIFPGAIIHNNNDTAGYFTTIQAYGTNGTTGVGGAGTYALSQTTSFTSRPTYTNPATFTASVDANGVMDVTSVAEGTLVAGLSVFSLDATYGGTGGLNGKGPTTIKAQLTGSAGSTGTYQLDNSSHSAIGSQQFQGIGQIRLTVNSTTGFTSGDTLHISGVTGQGGLPQRTNGLKWIKVIDGTHIDLFQWTFDGSYASGGVAGGDRTSLTPPGSIVMMTGYALQAYWGAPYGYPSNPHWFEFLTVASTNSTTHQICFTTPLVNTYKETWPQMNTGSQFNIDPGGPATLYALPSSWNLTHVYRDFTLDNPGAQTASSGKTVTFNNVLPTGGHCMIPSVNGTYNWVGINGSACNIETDKIVGTWNIVSSSINILTVQSSSIDLINATDSTFQAFNGTPKRAILNNVTSNTGVIAGSTAYGVTDELSCTNCNIATSLTGAGPTQRVDLAPQPWSMAGGIITIPNAYNWNACCATTELQIRGIVPGKYVIWSGGGRASPFTPAQTGRIFKVDDVTQDLDNIYVHTSEAGGFPTGDWTFNGLSVRPHPAPMLTMSGTTGGAAAKFFDGCPAQAPIFSCASYTHTGGASGTTPLTTVPTIWGEIDSFTFTNNVPYTGAGSLSWTLPQFVTLPYLKPDNTQSLIQLSINTKLPSSCGSCTRTLTSSGATNTQSGDSFPASIPAGAVFGSGFGLPVFSANTPSDSPQVTVTLRTNQNLPP